VSLLVNPIGKPDAANLHVRFDERGSGNGAMAWTETPVLCESHRPQQFPTPTATAPTLPWSGRGHPKYRDQ
jgi:hypothetical protein